jgi:hypothetical protein
MPQDTPFRGRGFMLLIVLGLIALGVIAYLVIMAVTGDQTSEIDPQNGQSQQISPLVR